MDEMNNLQETQVEALSSGEPTIATPQEVNVDQIIIGADITDEDRSRVYERLGRPPSPDKYDLNGIVPDKYNHSLVDKFKEKAFENGMSNEGVRNMANWYKEVEVAHQENINKQRAQQAEYWKLELQRDFGTKFDENIKYARKGLDAYTDKAFRQYMDESGLGNNPALVKAFAKIGRELSEDKLVQSETANRLVQDEQLRRSEILRLRSDKQFMDKYRRGDPAAVQRLNSLYTD